MKDRKRMQEMLFSAKDEPNQAEDASKQPIKICSESESSATETFNNLNAKYLGAGFSEMFTEKTKVTVNVLVIASLLISGMASLASGQTIVQCESCGMDVTLESQSRYRITDGNGNTHLVECYMCALALINEYESLHIETVCDWYGPDFPVTVDSSNYGGEVVVSPLTAMFLRGGSCVTARAAYNQTAADNLLSEGFSQFMSPEQRYALPSSTQVKLVSEAIEMWYSQPRTTGTSTPLALILVAVIGVTIVITSIFAYRKLGTRSRQTEVKT